MYLKSLKLVGFKSFADRTRLEFRPGVTVVVGPNGSGKSNLVDALSWVLGTQSTKSLRTQKMEDVIFAGTATRPSLGRAEATLVIDNSDRSIDLDLDEIAITRRLYRDGSSDYELNGVGCRLLDIQDLLSDSGVGRHQHVIIGQGEIGRVLNASEEDHRAVIEEAAGILKHRRRKERSERRLERTDEDLIRLQDLIGEINRQMRPLRRQAKSAERYDGLKSEVVALTLHLAGRRLSELDRGLTVATSEKAMLTESLDVDVRRLDVVSGRLEELTEQLAVVSDDLDRDTTAAAMLETTVERLRRLGSVALERRRASSGRQEAIVERRADLQEESSAIAAKLSDLESERTEATSLAEIAETRFRRLEDEESAIATQNALSPEGALAAARGELSALNTAQIRDQREIETVEKRLDALTAQIADEKTEIDVINGEVRSLDELITGLHSKYDHVSAERAQLQVRWSDAEETLEQVRLEEASAVARVEALHAALDHLADPVARATAGRSAGAVGTLIGQLDVPEGLEVAAGAALGEWADAVAFIDSSTIQDAVRRIKEEGGSAVALVTSTGHGPTPATEVTSETALVSLLGDASNTGLASHLLGDVVVVEDWIAGWELVQRHPNIRAVTREGDLVTTTGVRLARPSVTVPALLEIAGEDAEGAARAVARATSLHTAAKRDFEKVRESERLALEQLEQSESTLSGRSEAMSRLQMSVAGREEELSRLTHRRISLIESVTSASAQMDTLQQRLAAMEGEEAERMRMWEDLEARRVQLAAKREAARSEWQEAATAVHGVVEREKLLLDRRDRVRQELNRLQHEEPQEIDEQRLSTVASYARRSVGAMETRIEELRERQASTRIARQDIRSELEALSSEHKNRSADVTRRRDRLAQLDVTLTEIRMKREAVAEMLRRDADGDISAAMSSELPGFAADETDLDGLLETKSAQLRRLGPINPLAAEEFRQLEERHTFLAEQMADVESSRAELRKVIHALEEEIESRFHKAFTEVADAYQRYFEALFPGGRGQIRLADPEDARSGVVIEAQPLGKKVSSMTLLSGGERSLAALAFLFSVFEARPSPFYVLDEVEAALDDANLRRFLRIVSAFRDKAQLLIVTHQQQTMGAADVLYGVTMEPGGSSQAVRKEMRVPVPQENAV